MSPNAYVAAISVQVRLHWPPRATVEEVRQALMDCYEKAARDLDENRRLWEQGDPAYYYDWWPR